MLQDVLHTPIHESVLTLLQSAVYSICVPIIANEQHCDQHCVYSLGCQ